MTPTPGPDVFDVDRHPLITFRSTATRARAESTWEVTGEPTVGERIAFSVATDPNRDDLGPTWNQTLETGGMLVGKTARIELNVQVAAADAAVA